MAYLLDGLSNLKPAKWEALEYGALYRITGSFHVQDSAGKLHAACIGAVAATYQGQLTGEPRRHIFTDNDGTRYVVSSPEFTFGIPSSRIFRFPKKRLARAA